MKILFDAQIFFWQNFGGISRYFYELIKNMDIDIEWKLPLIYSENEYIATKDISSHYTFLQKHNFRGKQRIINTINREYFNFYPKSNIDLIHPTYYDAYFLKSIGKKPFVLTVYDMIHELYSTLFDINDITIKNKKLLCEKATKIIAISENTKNDLIKLFNIDPSKIDVIYLGQSLTKTPLITLPLPKNYILFTGQRWGYKNFNRFVEAFALLPKHYTLICTGSPFTHIEKEMFYKLKLSDRVLSMFATDTQLAELYSRADLFVFPSEYEGFGIPILEAMTCGCPIALSNSSSFPEIAGQAGGYFNPQSIDSIYKTMNDVLADQVLRKHLVESGYIQAKKFSWVKMGKETSNLYKSLL